MTHIQYSAVTLENSHWHTKTESFSRKPRSKTATASGQQEVVHFVCCWECRERPSVTNENVRSVPDRKCPPRHRTHQCTDVGQKQGHNDAEESHWKQCDSCGADSDAFTSIDLPGQVHCRETRECVHAGSNSNLYRRPVPNGLTEFCSLEKTLNLMHTTHPLRSAALLSSMVERTSDAAKLLRRDYDLPHNNAKPVTNIVITPVRDVPLLGTCCRSYFSRRMNVPTAATSCTTNTHFQIKNGKVLIITQKLNRYVTR